MFKKKTNPGENEIPSPENLCNKTKDTLHSYIAANSFVGFATGFAAGVTFAGVLATKDKSKKIIMGAVGGILTVASTGLTAKSLGKADDFIDNHVDCVKLNIAGQFLNAEGEGAKNELIKNIANELHTKLTK